VEESKCLGTTLTNHNSIQEEIKRRMKSGNACYHSVQDLLSSNLLSKNLKIKIHRTIILPVVLYGQLGRLGRRCDDNIKKDIQEVGWGAWTGSVLLRIGTGDGHL